MLSANTKPSFEIGLPILKACVQEGNDATKYSNVFDLTSGEISLVSFSDRNKTIHFNLMKELSKGGHYYDLPQIESQKKMPLMPLKPTMYRYLIDGCKPVKDKVPKIAKSVKQLIEGLMKDTLNQQDFNPEFWRFLVPNQKDAQKELKSYGRFKSLTLLENATDTNKNYLFALDFEFQTVLQRYFFDNEGRIAGIKNEGSE
jgi:hypothetical protein